MDADLAFCLGQFIDDQVKFIDDRLEAIKQEEVTAYDKIEQEKIIYNKNKPIPKNKGTHYEDQALIDQFIQDLCDDDENVNKPKSIIDDQSCIDTLRAEISTKVNACSNYIIRIRNLAQPLPRTSKFVESCNEAIDYFRQLQEFEDNFKKLYSILEQSDSSNVVQNSQKWWKDTYGSTVAELNRRNTKINPAITENNFAILSSTSRVIDNAKKLMAARQVVSVEPQKLDIIRKFVKRLLIIDEENRDKINAEELIDQLNNSNIKQIIDYTKKWIAKRDEIRNHKEVDPFNIRMEAAKAEFGRRRIAQEAKRLALAALLCRLAVGSTNGEQFEQQLKKTINKRKGTDEENLPVISGDIKDPQTQALPITIRLDADRTDMKQWAVNTDGIQERFVAALCQAFAIPTQSIRVDSIESDEAMIYMYIEPPYGKVVVDSLNGTAPDAAARMQAIRKCCCDLNANVESITLGEFGLKIEDRLMDPRWNKKYAWSNNNPDEGQYWPNPINQGGKPYYCPSGWIRFGVKVAEDNKEFDARWGDWYVAYHGTRNEYASNILTSGLRVSTAGCFYGDEVPRVYVSPSIEYCGHPRYALPWKQVKKNGETRWYQLVFQCRVNPASVDKISSETLIPKEHKQTVTIDPNFDNGELEWIILGKHDEQFIKQDIICYGLMMRVSYVDPINLTPCTWWKHSLYSDIYKS
ncbi:unnamed protein product [Rotaria sp. Silwood2]|nr:unnamed protein product [Rotaria sp. Silwood2]CAF4219653.1 unnamed protein product [Rotaria sp. Silwood2]